MNSVIRRIEELSMNGMPSLSNNFFDGWIMRFSKGYTKRGNSILPVYGGEKDVFNKIEYCENIYKSKNQKTIFKLTSDKEHKKLDEILEGSGYVRDSDNLLLVGEIKEMLKLNCNENITITTGLTEEWLSSYTKFNNLDDKKDIIGEVLNNIVGQPIYVNIKEDFEIIAVALGVIDDGFTGIFDVIVKEELRGKGYGKDLIKVLLNEGFNKRSRMAYLQVRASNKGALDLYSKFGFEELYKYWYRIKE